MKLESNLFKNNLFLNLENLPKNLSKELLIKLINYPLLAEGVNRRVVHTNFAGNLNLRFKDPLIEGYTISDWINDTYKAKKYFTLEELNNL